MESYTGFAQVYDELMDNVPYKEWTSYVISLLSAEGVRDGIVLDLGCGTGNVTELLAAAGYDMIGVDLSEDMLSIAQRKKEHSGADILYICQDMREFELYGTVAGIVSICDSLNYITDSDDLLAIFKLVKNYLDPGGVFIFDLNTPYKYRYLLGDNTFAETRDDCSFIWENTYDPESGLNEYDLTLFVKECGESFRRFEEVHIQKSYTVSQIKKLIRQAGLTCIHVYDAFTYDAPQRTSERVYFVVNKV